MPETVPSRSRTCGSSWSASGTKKPPSTMSAGSSVMASTLRPVARERDRRSTPAATTGSPAHRSATMLATLTGSRADPDGRRTPDSRTSASRPDRRLPAAGASAGAPPRGVAERRVTDLAREAVGTALDAPVDDESRADAHGAGEVEDVVDAAGDAERRLTARGAVGVVVDPHRSGAEGGTQLAGDVALAPVQVGCAHDGAGGAVDLARHRDRDAEHPPPVGLEGRQALAREPLQRKAMRRPRRWVRAAPGC